MKTRIGFILAALILTVSVVAAFNLTITVPNAIAAEAAALCNSLRVSMRARAMTNEDCATEFLRRGLRDFRVQVTTSTASVTRRDTIAAALTSFDADFPIQVAIVTCGDGVTDTEYGEECDDGNVIAGDGCDPDCLDETDR